MKRTLWTKAVVTAAAAVGLAACGGGGSSNGTTPPAAAVNTPVISSGAITGFGSVFVNGVRFDTSSATFTINGKAGTQADLRVGHVVTVHGHHDDNGHSTADRIDFDDAVKGPVDSIDAAAGTLVVMGQTVLTDADTSFDDNIPGASLAGLNVGDIVEVSGMRRADGDIQATRIEAKPAGTAFEVTGVVSNVDTAAHKLNVNALVVDYSAATVRDFPNGQPANGDLLEAKGSSVNGAGELVASSIELKRDDDDASDGMELELEGLITRFVSATDFDVAGKPVTTNSSTRFENGSAADLALNVKVEAEGQVDANGVLVANKVEFKRQASSRIEAPVDAVDVAANKLVVLGIDVTVNANTRVEDKGDARVPSFNVGSIVAGDFVEVRGSELPAESNDVVASRLERRRAEDEVRLRGVVDAATAPSFSILGVTIQTNAGTEFENSGEGSIGADDFFAEAVGRNVEVKGTVSGGVFTAREVEFEDD
ncbi:MAG TPA: DUF5666 domain-containing protein [Steroidobacteraceae bacterium]|jgi:hypothetical protein